VEQHDEMIENAAREELVKCIELLALNVAHHRNKFGTTIPMIRSFDYLTPGTHAALGNELRQTGQAVQLEALRLVVEGKEQANALLRGDQKKTVVLDEKRVHVRLSISAPIHITSTDGKWSKNATLQDLSWGGAAFYVAVLPHELPGELSLRLPGPEGANISVRAEVLRVNQTEKGALASVRFSSMGKKDDKALRTVLETLLAYEDEEGKRQHPRLAQRLEIEYGDQAELQGTLEDISTGGLLLTIPEPLELDQSLQISIRSIDGRIKALLRARTVHQQLIELQGIEMYRVGFQFEHPVDELNDTVNALLRRMAFPSPP
jgi:c-di-GMP-binding flagellar brake protein YcgR